MTIQVIVCFVILLAGETYADFDIVKDTTNGKILGTVRTLLGVEEYLGIPYAAPPVGELRWKAPVDFPSWKDSGEIRNATYVRSVCPQEDEDFGKIIGNEDCLFLNVYVPRTPMFELYPVMVFMHRGSFQKDAGSNYDGSLLARQGDVIVVTFNYRMGALGFLNTGDNQARGNFGLLDQKAVLEWVQGNALNFQGDPDRVTIFGAASGGVSTLLHAISPQNQNGKKLFHRVISESGSPFCWWGFQTEPEYHAMKLFERAGCPTYSTVLALECLRGMDAADIVYWQLQSEASDYPWVPTVDGTYITDIPDVMVSETSLISNLASRYEYLIGSNDFESAYDYYVIKDIKDRDGFVDYMRSKLRSHFFNYEKVAEAVALNYIDPVNPPMTDLEWQYLSFNASRDLTFLAPTLNMTYLASSEGGFNSSAYYYFFAHKPGPGLVDAGLAYPSADIVDGATHSDEIAYVFGQPLTLPNVTNADRQISTEVMTYWTNFAKTGNPSLGSDVPTEWPRYDLASQKYLQFGNKDPNGNSTAFVKDYLESNKAVFWTRELGFFEEGKGINDSADIPLQNVTQIDPVEPLVTTNKGIVRGLRITGDDYILDRFLRIPFAKPPLGLLRFQRTQPHPGWNGILDATGNRSIAEWLNGCPVFNFVRNGSYGKEDCLFLNIYVPGGVDAIRDQQLPVMVWFYGGAFVWGRGTGLRFYYDMERICNQGNVIGVTINYRLGPLGFLSTMDEFAPGNAGLLDQAEALQWVQENIAAFGGDPNKVTIFAESGSIPAAWSISYEPLKPAYRLAQSLGCPIDSSKLLVKCLQNKPVDKIVKAGLYNDFREAKNNAWAAVVDGYFLIDDPINLATRSINKDLLIGHNSMDGFLFAAPDFSAILLDILPMSRDDIIKASSMFAPHVPDWVAEAVAFKYIDWEEPDTGLLWPKFAVVNMYSDNMFVVPSYWNANERAAANGTGRTYMYRFSEKARFGVFPEWKEADHTTELVYTFGHPFEGRNFDDVDRKLSLAMMTHWTNFAWSGNPNFPNQGDVFTEWPEYTLDTKYAMELNTSTASDPETYPYLLSNYRGEIVEYWTDHLRDLWNLPLDICPVTSARAQKKKWINHDSERKVRAVTCPDEPLVRNTEGGCIRGYELESNGATIERYLGIPYAKPPVGELRFMPPSAAESWTDVYSTTNFSKICPQYSVLYDTMSEDCLYLNIYVPKINATNEAGLPVMVWLHGGGYMNGNGMEKLQGDTLAAYGGVIVINFNYRLGSFGFMTTDDISSPGNYGLLDQQFALNWVKNNIANFGGDPDGITIFGNSAGGQSVLLQSLSPTNRNLGISKAIIESASIVPHDDLKQVDSAISLAEIAGCDTKNGNEMMVECLRNLDAADLLAAQAATGFNFGPTVDGEFLPSHPRELAEQAEVEKWTYIIGANNGDGSVRWGSVQTVTNEEKFHDVIYTWFLQPYGWRTSIIDQHYADYDDLNFFSDEKKMQIHLTEMFGDERYITPALEVAEDYTLFGADVYFYFFTYPHDRPDFYGVPSWIGAPHSAEFSFVWGDVINDDTQSDDVKDLSRRIMAYWSNFAKTGNPNEGYPGDSTPAEEWATYKGKAPTPGLGSKYYIQLDLGNKTALKQDLRPTEKTLWLEYMVSQAKYCEVEKPTPEPTSAPPVDDLENPEVVTTYGRVVGTRKQSDLYDVQAFLQVRYAKPPIRYFEYAEPATPWTDLWDARITPNPPCTQWNTSDNTIIGAQNCLYLDIHMPTGLLSTNSTLMPILFWVHGEFIEGSTNMGGSFWSGGGNVGWSSTAPNLDPSYLAHVGNVVVVTPNYRLGPFGFLTTESEGLAGNYGLSDLRQALQWIHSNAEVFAADPNKITVIGQGSGAAAAELLGVLPSTKDYVSRVISMSGSSFAPWAFCVNSECKNVANEIAETNGCSGLSSATEIRDCLNELEPEEILSAIPFKPVSPNSVSNAWGTWRFSQDGDIIPKDVTLEELFASSNCDFISGIASNEFFKYLEVAYPAAGRVDGLLHQSINDTYRFLAYSNVENWPSAIYNTLLHEYTNWNDRYDSELQYESANQYYNDLMFAVHSSKSISAKSLGSGSLFQYVNTRLSLQDSIGPQLYPWTGAFHGDDVIYTFGTPFLEPSSYSDADRDFSLSLMSYWINFAWHGDPNNDLSRQKWQEYGSGRLYLEMDTDINLPIPSSDYNLEKNSLWRNVVPDFAPDKEIVIDTTTTSLTMNTTMDTTTPQSTKPDECVEEIPPIGTGIGLSLTPEQADTAIYTMFSICLILGTVILVVLLHWYCSYRVLKSKNQKILSENHYTEKGTLSSMNGYNNITFEGEKPREGQISAL